MNKEGYFHPETENYKFWTSIEEQKLKELVQSNKYSVFEISKIMNRSLNSCQTHSSTMGLKNYHTTKKYSVNENFWTVPNRINCYWAGVSAADCSIIEKPSEYFGKSYTYVLELQIRDKEHLELLKNTVNYTGNVKVYSRTDCFKPTEIRYTAKIIIGSNKWGFDLKNNFNIVPNKTKRLAPPNIDNDYLLLCWLAGYCDGDGTIHLHSVTDTVQIKLCSSSKIILDFVKELFDRNFPDGIKKTKSLVRKLKHANCWEFNISGIKSLIFIDYIRQIEIPLLKRKWNNPKILDKIDVYKQKYPHLFKTLVIPPEYLEHQQDTTKEIISQIPDLVVT